MIFKISNQIRQILEYAFKRCSKFIFLFFLLFPFSAAFSQDFPMLHYSVDEGLPGNTVYEIYRDKKGFLWVATNKGVARFNGIKFEVFTTFDGLPDNEIFMLKEDLYGRLWFGTFNGELCYYQDGIFHSAGNTPFLRLPFKASYIRSISQETDSSITIGFSNQSKFINIKNGHTTVIDYKNILDKNASLIILLRKKTGPDSYQLTFTDTVYTIDSNASILNILPLTNSYFGKLNIYTYCQDQNYLVNENAIFTSDLKKVSPFPKTIRISTLHQLYIDSPNIFYATANGLIINDSLEILHGNNISSVTQDYLGDYWISTLGNGIFCIKNKFKNTGLSSRIYEKTIKYATVYKNKVFFATDDNKLYRLEKNKSSCIFSYFNQFPENKEILSKDLYCLIDSDRYFSYFQDNLVVADHLFSDKLTNIRKFPASSGNKTIFLVKGYLFLKSITYFKEIDYQYLIKKSQYHIHKIFEPGTNERIFGAAFSTDNSLWYSTVFNMYKTEIPEGNTIPQIKFKDYPLKSFDFLGRYLIGYTHNNRLLVCENPDSPFVANESINQNCIWDKFCRLDSTHMLISTNNLYRIVSLNPPGSNPKFSILTVENPYIPLQAEAICSDGSSCWFFKNGSVTTLELKDILLKSNPPQLFFNTIKTANSLINIDSEMTIPFGNSRNISIRFSTLSFGGKDILCQYSISKNGEDYWRDVNGNEINLINTGYGTYEIKIRGKTLSGDYSIPAKFILSIQRPFWATWWFIMLLVLVVMVIIIVFFRYRIVHAIHKKEKEHQKEIRFMKSEFKALNALMNPHFIFNTLNNVQGLFNANDKVAANEYLRIFSDLIRQNMHNISKELIPLQKEIDLVTNYLLLEKLRFEDRLSYSINISNDLDLSDIMMPPLLIQPLVENSIKHGILPMQGNGAIEINIYEKLGILYIEVKDTGAGMSQSVNHKNNHYESYGLENIKKRIAQLGIIQNKEIKFGISETVNTIGMKGWTTVTISMPLSD